MSRPPLPLVLVAGLLSLVVAAGQGLPAAPTAGAEPTEAAPAPVVGAHAVCPDLQGAPGTASSTVSVGVASAADGATGQAAPGRIDGRALTGGDGAALPIQAPGQVVADLAAGLSDDAYLVQADGALAGGLVVQQTTRAGGGTERGLSTVRCESARTDAWYAGGGTTVGETSTLVLVNPDDAPAVVDVALWSAEGPVEARPGRSLSVPPGERRVVELDTLAPDRSQLAVRVQATRGRVASSLRHERFDGLVPRGAEAVPRTSPPAELVVVPGVPAGPGERRLQVTNPGADDVVVAVELTAGDGQFVPAGLDAVDVPAGSTVGLDLGPELVTPAAVTVRSAGGPVLAVALVVEQPAAGELRELAYVAAAPPLDGPAVLPDVTVGPEGDQVLLLSALTGDAVVDVETLPVVGAPALSAPARRVEAPGGRTVALPLSTLLPAGTVGRTAVQVRPGALSSPVHAGSVTLLQAPDGPLVTATALSGAQRQVPRPEVLRDPAVGVAR